MNLHENARLTPIDRKLLIERLARGEHPTDVAGAAAAAGLVAAQALSGRARAATGSGDATGYPVTEVARLAAAMW